MPTDPIRGYGMHGGAGAILSVGLLRALNLEAFEECVLTLYTTGGDAMHSICLWRVCIIVSLATSTALLVQLQNVFHPEEEVPLVGEGRGDQQCQPQLLAIHLPQWVHDHPLLVDLRSAPSSVILTGLTSSFQPTVIASDRQPWMCPLIRMNGWLPHRQGLLLRTLTPFGTPITRECLM